MHDNPFEVLYERAVTTLAKTAEFFQLSATEARLFATLYIEGKPLTLDNMSRLTGKSKTSVNTSIRTLYQAKLVELVWVKGERKDHYQADEKMYEKLLTHYMEQWKVQNEQQQHILEEIHTAMKQQDHDRKEHKEMMKKVESSMEFHQLTGKVLTKITATSAG